MTNPLQFNIIGTGAVGGYYGSRLQQAGFHVNFLLRTDYEHVSKKGLIIESPRGDFQLPHVHAFNNPKQMPPADVVIVALKTTATPALTSILPAIVKEDTIILTLQNGLGSETAISTIVGEKNIIGGLCFLCANKVSPGHIRHIDYGLITLGEYQKNGLPGGITSRIKQLGSNLKSAGIPIELVADLPLARWKKLMWNIPFNGLSVIKNTRTDELVKNPKTRELCRILMKEVMTAAAACARPIEPDFIESMISNTEKMKPYSPSMKLDFDRGNPMEIESIYGLPLQQAKAAGIEMPETEKLYHQLRAIQP